VTDVVMPTMSGPALAQRFVESRPTLAVLLVSGYGNIATSQWPTSNRRMRLLVKPFEASMLTTTVRDLLELTRPVA
jgi:two-component system cell cycle sensor histidine kinase/response regulator CckA